MDAKKLLFKAVECDKAGRVLEAQYLYQEGISILMNLLTDEPNTAKKKAFGERIKEYLDRAEEIKVRVKNQLTGGEIEKHISIDENSTGHSYNTLFGSYLNHDVWEVLLEEPYLVERYHFQNLVIFFELMLKKCPNLKYIRVLTKSCTKNAPSQRSTLENLQVDLQAHDVTLNIVYEDSLHDRKITLSNHDRRGYIIKIGRGLHFFKATTPLFSLGLCDYDFRKCLQTDVDILRTKK